MALYGSSLAQIFLRWYKHTYAYLSTRLCTRTSFKTFATNCKAFEQDTVVIQLIVSFYFEENGKQK